MTYKIHQGDNRDILKTLADNSIDAIVTDPPYGIDFLGKSWDANTGALETYQECLRVLKPGGHILAFSAARTYHHLAITLEQAGFEIRDQIMWIYSSGFPKSQDVGRQIQKAIYGKPDKQRFDPATMIKVAGDTYRHPDTGKIYRKLPDINGDRLAKSHEGQGYGCVFEEVMNIKKVPHKHHMPRIGGSQEIPEDKETIVAIAPEAVKWSGWGTQLKPAHEPIALARKPLKQSIAANCQEWGTGAINIDATRIEWDLEAQERIADSNANGGIKIGKGIEKYGTIGEDGDKTEDKALLNEQGRFPSNVLGEIAEEYQKYFYCPKVSRQERHMGFEDPGAMFPGSRFDVYMPTAGKTNPETTIEAVEEKLKDKGNNHPTVKPIELMKYLIKLITPPGGVVLDPFNGSGSTGVAATELGFDYIGCELDPKYVEISIKRIEAWRNRDYDADVFDSLFTFGD
jgi:DNA modification methylase